MASVASTTSEVEARGGGGGAAGAGAGLSPERDGSWAFTWGLRGQSAFGYFGCRVSGCRARGPGRSGAAAIGAWPRPGIVVARKSDVTGKSVSVRVVLGGRRSITTQKNASYNGAKDS